MARDRAALIAEIPHLRRFARSLTRDPDAADDLVQSCLERALSRFHLWRPERRLRPWLFTMLRNLHVDTVRHRSAALAREQRSAAVVPLSQRPGQEDSLTARRVLEAIDRLPADQRDAVLMVCVNDLTYGQAAAVLDIPQGTLMSRLHRGRARLRESLGLAERRPGPGGLKPLRRVK